MHEAEAEDAHSRVDPERAQHADRVEVPAARHDPVPGQSGRDRRARPVEGEGDGDEPPVKKDSSTPTAASFGELSKQVRTAPSVLSPVPDSPSSRQNGVS